MRPRRAAGARPIPLALALGLSLLGLGLALALAPAPARAAHGGPPSVAMTEPDYLKWLIDSHQPVVVVDLRKPREFQGGHLPGAISVPIGELDRRYGEIPTTPMVVLYCQCSIEEAATAYSFLEAKGYLNHVVLQEGYDGWLRRRYPIVK
ncbi:MAG TPA: rhodanese-like domain-containing protein [Candidatus Dormibacteraeota bacterium]|nr:rhodanese-like domain-containing protein [Candidatus Dormibacteraeota bacterium]